MKTAHQSLACTSTRPKQFITSPAMAAKKTTESAPAGHIVFFPFLSSSLTTNLPAQSASTPIFFGWTTEVASSLGVRHATFTTCSGYGTAAYFSLWVNPPLASNDADEFCIPGFPESVRISRTQLSPFLREAGGSDRCSTFFCEQIRLSTNTGAMLSNTDEEIEPTGLEILRKMVKSPVLAIGPLLLSYFLHREQAPPSPSQQPIRPHKQLGIAAHDCMQWLNLHPPSSVLFVSFGSQNTIAAAQMMELAKGLESSGHRFIWVIRPPLGNDVNVDIRPEWLPPGFEERMNEKKQGLLARRWAPQLEILSHSSTGAFLSHCGWNSTLESLSQGIPIIGWPLASEQFYNSKMMEEEMGVSVEVGRGVADQEVSGEKVERMVRMVMGDTSEKGREMREKAQRVGEMIRASMADEVGKVGLSLLALDDFLFKTALAPKSI